MSYIGGALGNIVDGSMRQSAVAASQLAQQQMYNQQQAVDHFYSNGLLGSLRQAGMYGDGLRNIATHRVPEIRGETFVQWHSRYQARIAELDANSQTWPWVEGENWRVDINEWADLYGSK